MVGHTIISAGTHLVAREATRAIDPLALGVFRMLSAAAIFLVLLAVTKGPMLPAKKDRLPFLAYGLAAGPLNQGLFLVGVRQSNATHASLLYALTPIGVYLASLALRRETSHPRRLLGASVAFAGVLGLLALGDDSRLGGGHWLGDLAILGAVFAWVAWTLEGRRMALTYGGLRTAGWAILSGAIWALPGLAFIDYGALADVAPIGWVGLGYLVALTSVVSYILWNAALARVEASRVAIFTNLQPVATAVAAWAILGEHLGWETALGGGLVLVGVRLAQS